MKMKNWYIIPLLSLSIFYGKEEQLIIPEKIHIRVETTNPSIFDFNIKVPAAEKLAAATERLAVAAENSSRAFATIPNALTKTVLITIGAAGAFTLVYQGIKRLEREKKDLLGFSFISTGIAGFVALCYLTTSKWFNLPV